MFYSGELYFNLKAVSRPNLLDADDQCSVLYRTFDVNFQPNFKYHLFSNAYDFI